MSKGQEVAVTQGNAHEVCRRQTASLTHLFLERKTDRRNGALKRSGTEFAHLYLYRRRVGFIHCTYELQILAVVYRKVQRSQIFLIDDFHGIRIVRAEVLYYVSVPVGSQRRTVEYVPPTRITCKCMQVCAWLAHAHACARILPMRVPPPGHLTCASAVTFPACEFLATRESGLRLQERII